jgi:carbonic anhydrase
MEVNKIDIKTALQKLIDGNKRYVSGNAVHPNQTAERRAAVADAPNPFAVILSCADARVPPEIIFDCGIGDLFVVRNAGNLVNDEVLGSIEYAVKYFGTRLIIVMGHTKCGAVSSAVQGGKFPGHIPALVNAILPAVKIAKGQSGDLVENSVIENVNLVVNKLKSSGPVLEQFIETGGLQIIGACYDMDSGDVVLNK